MSPSPSIVVLDRAQSGEPANPAPERILAGIPRARLANQYADPQGRFFCGVWSSSVGKWRVQYTEHECCVLLEGRVRIESDAGERREFQAGDAFVVPAGFNGTWEVLAPCRKWYALYEPAAGQAAAGSQPDGA